MMAISRQAYFPSLVMTVALIVVSAPAVYTQVCRVYEFCQSDNIVRVNPTSSPFLIQSPNYGNGLYPHNVNCSLTIASNHFAVTLSFYFREFNVEYQPTCAYDFLMVNGVKYCGAWEIARMLPTFLPGTSVSILQFITDSSVARTGFQIIAIPELPRNNGFFMNMMRHMPDEAGNKEDSMGPEDGMQ